MMRTLTAALAAAVLLGADLPAQVEGPGPDDLARIRAELDSLKVQMQRKDAEISSLRGELDQIRNNTAEPGQGLERLQAETAALRASLLGADLRDEHGASEYPKVKVGGQLRWRFENRVNFDFDRTFSGVSFLLPDGTPVTDYGEDIYLVEQRARLNADVQLNEWVSAFVEVQDARQMGEEMGPLDDSADGIDMHQAYMKIEDFLGTGGSLRVGRAEWNVANQRLISSLDWSTQARAFDGIFFDCPIEQIEDASFHFSAVKLRQQMPVGTNSSEIFTAGFEMKPFSDDVAKQSTLHPYIIFLSDDGMAPNWESSSLWTASVLFESQFNSGFYVEAEGALQAGHSTNRIGGGVRKHQQVELGHVYAYVVRAGYKAFDCAYQPSFIIEWNQATGDSDGNTDSKNTRFNPLFPFAHNYNGYMDFVLWQNTRNLAFRFAAVPMEDLKVGLDTWLFWTDRNNDFSGGPNLIYPAAPVGKISRHLGTEVDLTAKYKTAKGVSILAGYSAFFPGGRIDDMFSDDDIAHFVYLMFGIKF